jgi:type IV pilus assembly protein PilB
VTTSADNIQPTSIPEHGSLPNAESRAKGPIARLLVESGQLTPEQLRYGQRIQRRLSTPKTLLRVLEDLHYLTRDQIHQALEANEGPIPLGGLLVELEIIRESELESALALQKGRPETKLGQILVDSGFIDEKALIEVFSLQLGYPRVSPTADRLDPELMKRASAQWYREHEFMPLNRRDGVVSLAFAFPLNLHQRQAARKLFGNSLSIGIARHSEIVEALDRYEAGRMEGPSATIKDSLVIQIVDQLISDAADADASDIHMEPMKDRLRIRFRVDGVLINHREFPTDLIPPITSRIKIMAGANIVEKRRHQDGRILFDRKGLSFDIRLSTYVTLHGETIVMRLLRSRSELLEVREIGMTPRMMQRYLEDVLDTPSGVVIVTGPTGSGKTTTLYASLNYLNDPKTSIITAEDPVEYVVEGISQCCINPKINLTYEDTLRSIVRQDPDIIVIGEIRDAFSAETAIQAALTGHKVLTTFHTEDSIGGLLRLLNMNIEAFLISSTVVSVVAQRLLRRVCPHCSEEQTPTPQQTRRLGYEVRELQGARFKVARSCKLCKFTGYMGRIAIFELLVLDEMIKDALIAHKTSYEIRRISADSTGLVTLLEDGILKALRGQTTFEEIIRQLPRLAKPRPLAELRRLLGEEL